MDARFLIDNSHLENAKHFGDADPDLCHLKTQKLIYSFKKLNQFPINKAGIFTLCGAFRTGKTTLLKQWMEKLLHEKVDAHAIAFLSCKIINNNYHNLYKLLKHQIKIMPKDKLIYLIVDEVTLIRGWEKTFLLLIKNKLLEHVCVMLSGSQITLPKIAKKMLPTKEKKYFHLYPLSFRETVLLKQGSDPTLSKLFEEFQQYLLHGGHLDAINDVAMHGHVLNKTLKTYAENILMQIIKQRKQERFLREILKTLLAHYNQQVTWNSLVSELSIEHPKTIRDYFELLESLAIVFVQQALLENTLGPAPKKARKIMFADPFIFHVIFTWIHSSKHSKKQLNGSLKNLDIYSDLVESCVITHFQRFYPTYYIKAEGEISLAYIEKSRFWPILIIWDNPLRAKDLKQILKYSNGRILTKTPRSGIIEHIKTESLPLALWQLGDMNLQ